MDIFAQTTETEHTQDGSLPEGFLFASFKNIGNSPAQVNNVTLQPGEAKAYPFVGKGYKEIDFSPNGSTLLVLYVS